MQISNRGRNGQGQNNRNRTGGHFGPDCDPHPDNVSNFILLQNLLYNYIGAYRGYLPKHNTHLYGEKNPNDTAGGINDYDFSKFKETECIFVILMLGHCQKYNLNIIGITGNNFCFYAALKITDITLLFSTLITAIELIVNCQTNSLLSCDHINRASLNCISRSNTYDMTKSYLNIVALVRAPWGHIIYLTSIIFHR